MPVPRSCSSRSNGPRPGPQACSTAWPPLACWLFYVPLAVHVSVAENGVWPWPILVILRLGADPSLAGLPAAGPKHRPSCPPPQRCPQKRAQPLLLEMRNGPCSGQLRQVAGTRWRGSASPPWLTAQDAGRSERAEAFSCDCDGRYRGTNECGFSRLPRIVYNAGILVKTEWMWFVRTEAGDEDAAQGCSATPGTAVVPGGRQPLPDVR